MRIAATAIAIATAVAAITFAAVWNAAHEDGASEVERVDAIVVLGAAQYDGTPSPVFAGRLDHAALLYREERSAVVVLLGAGAPGDATTEAQAGADYLEDAGVPADAIVVVPRGRTTLQSLRAASRILDERGLETVFLVSDPWHNLRIERMASDLGVQAYASATWTSAAISQRTRLSGYLRETAAYLAYRILGR